MDLAEYQAEAAKTDQVPGDDPTAIIVPLLGLAGEVGELLTEFKKHRRDGDAHQFFTERAAEELGDLLWYAANVATKFGLELDKIAVDNVAKCQDRWAWRSAPDRHGNTLDDDYPEPERLPHIVKLEVTDVEEDGRTTMRASIDGKPVGNALTDNAYSSDGYRFHDVFHLTFASCLGWSPVLRTVLGRKRKSNPATDEVEDGGRATAIEEGLSAIIFDYAKDHNFLDGVRVVDGDLLKTIKSVTAHLEVGRRTSGEWERAILMGYDVWRQVRDNRGGVIVGDLVNRRITYEAPPQSSP